MALASCQCSAITLAGRQCHPGSPASPIFPNTRQNPLPEIRLWHWFAFAGLVVLLLTLDLAVFHRRDRTPTLGESAAFTLLWCLLAAAFNGLVWRWRGSEAGVQFLTGYLVEWSLSMDNVFVFAVIFRFFQVPRQHQYPVLFWGILGAIVLRLGFILAGAALIRRLDWIVPAFGVFLIYAAYRMARQKAGDIAPDKNPLLRLSRRFLPVASGNLEDRGHRFFLRQDGRWRVTPLLLVLVVIESTDLLFAIDSVPAIFGITTDPYIVFTSNVFAILGLRALYFLLAGVMDTFRYLHYGLAGVLGFVGIKMIAAWQFQHRDGTPFCPAWASLAAIVAILGGSIAVSLVVPRLRRNQP